MFACGRNKDFAKTIICRPDKGDKYGAQQIYRGHGKLGLQTEYLFKGNPQGKQNRIILAVIVLTAISITIS